MLTKISYFSADDCLLHFSLMWGLRGHPRSENFEISSPRKRDFAIFLQSQRVLITHFFFSKVKMPFFLPQNITNLRKNDANCQIIKLWLKIYYISSFFQFCVSLKTGSTRSILRGHLSAKGRLKHRILINGLFVLKVPQSQAWQSFRCHGGG